MKSLLLILLAITPAIIFGQDVIKTQDPAAEAYLDNVAANFKADKAYQVEFRYEIYSAMHDATISDYGSIIVKGNMYKLKTEDTEVIFNGKYLWVYNTEAGEVYQSVADEDNPDQILADPFRLLGNYKDYYKYLFKGQQDIAGNMYSQIDLYPIALEADYSILRILCTEGGVNIYSIMMKQKNGTEITVFINDLIRNINIAETIFTWNEKAHPDVLLIEM